MVTSTTPVTSPNNPTSGASFFTDLGTMARRDLMRVMRQPEALTFSLIMGIFFLLLFYITALNGSTQTGSGLALDLSEGVTDRFRSLPMSQLSVLAGRTIADGVRNFVGLVLLATFGYLLGFRFDSLAGGTGAVLVAAVIGYAFSWINAAIGAKVQNAEMVSMLTMFWLFPLMFASNVFTPTDAMPSWLKAFADNQPISAATEAVRALSDGTDATKSVMLTIAWSIGLVVVFASLAVRSYRRAG